MVTKLTIGQLQKKLWRECRRIALILYVNKNGTYDCYTCEQKDLQGSNRQLGHFIAKSVCGAFLKYDMRNLRWQCMRCNCNLSGNGAIFYRNLVEKEGQNYVDNLFKDKLKSIKAYDRFAEQLLEYQHHNT
jgi:hypothetical protein